MPRLEVADIFRAHGPTWRQHAAGALQPRPVEGHVGDRAVSQRRPGRPLAALFSVRATADRLQLLPQPTLPEVPGERRTSAGSRHARLTFCPCEYYHVVFTLPAPISAIAYTNKELIYGLLFDIAAETLRTIAADPKHLGARIGTTLVLHTWGSAMTHHPHVHGIVPGGGLAPDADRWVPCKPGFFLSVRVLSRLFRRRFLEELQNAPS